MYMNTYILTSMRVRAELFRLLSPRFGSRNGLKAEVDLKIGLRACYWRRWGYLREAQTHYSGVRDVKTDSDPRYSEES